MSSKTQRIITLLVRTIIVGWMLFICLMALAACTPQQKLAKLVGAHPELLQMHRVEFSDTLIRPGESDCVTFDNLSSSPDSLYTADDMDSVIVKIKGARAIFIGKGKGRLKIETFPDTIARTFVKDIPTIRLVTQPSNKESENKPSIFVEISELFRDLLLYIILAILAIVGAKYLIKKINENNQYFK